MFDTYLVRLHKWSGQTTNCAAINGPLQTGCVCNTWSPLQSTALACSRMDYSGESEFRYLAAWPRRLALCHIMAETEE